MSPVVATLVMAVIVVILIVGIYNGMLGPALQDQAVKIVACMNCALTPSTCSGCE